MKENRRLAPSPSETSDRRVHIRFDKLFPVLLSSELFGDMPAIARNVSSGGILVEVATPLPLGTLMTVHFRDPASDVMGKDDDRDIVATAEVKHHYCINIGADRAVRAMGLRFTDFSLSTRFGARHAAIH